MAISEESRHRLHLKLADVLGPDEAGLLMEHLPPVGWADVATKHDLDHLAALTKRDIDQFGTTLQLEMARMETRIREDMTSMEAGIRGDMTSMEAGIRGDMTSMEAGIRQELHNLSWRLITLLSAGYLTMAGLLVTRPHL